MTEIELELLLINWARWARASHLSTNHCKSLEHRYRSPQTWHREDLKVAVDILQAHRVENAVVILKPSPRTLIVYSYLTPNQNLWQICRKAGIKAYQFPEKLHEARIKLQTRLTFAK